MPSRADRLPEELFEPIIKYICILRKWDWDFVHTRSLRDCSLTCRYWATRIRPAIFSHVTLTSQSRTRTFLALLPSPVVVPGLLRDIVREISLVMAEDSRPWMYHVWALLRNGALPNLRSINVNIRGQSDDIRRPEAGRSKCEALLDVGLPRRLPSSHQINLHTLSLTEISFRSYESLLRTVAYYCTEKIACYRVQWPETNAIAAPAGYLLSRLNLHAPRHVSVMECTVWLPFLWTLITTHPPISRVTQRLLYISTTQIGAVMDIVHLISGIECECRSCQEVPNLLAFELRTYTGAY